MFTFCGPAGFGSEPGAVILRVELDDNFVTGRGVCKAG